MASLRHSSVVNFFGICFEPPCILTEYCSRGSLADLLGQCSKDPQMAATLTWPQRLSLVGGHGRGFLLPVGRGLCHLLVQCHTGNMLW